MAVGSGIAQQLGVSPEVTYGTYVAPAKFLQVDKVSIKKVKNIAQGNGLGAGRLMALGSRRVPTTKAAAGSISLEVVNKTMGPLLQALMGTTVTPVVQGATAAYLQTHTLADNVGKMLTIQHGVPDTTGTVRPYTYLGCKITGAEFTFDLSAGEVMATFDLDAKDVVESQGLVAASYATGTRPFVSTDVTVRVGTFGAEVAVTGIKKITVKIERPQDTGRFYFGATVLGTKAEPLQNDYVKVSGSITSDFVDKTIWADRFAADTATSVVVEAIGNLIASTFFETFRIRLPQVFLDGDTPTVDGPDVVKTDFPFTCLFDGTNYPAIEYMSTDTTV